MNLFKAVPFVALAVCCAVSLTGCEKSNSDNVDSSFAPDSGSAGSQTTLGETNQKSTSIDVNKDPIDIILEGKDKVISASKLSTTIEIEYNGSSQKVNTRTIKKDDGSEDIYSEVFYPKNEEANAQSESLVTIVKDGYQYWPSLKLKSEVNDSKDAEEGQEVDKDNDVNLLSILTKENIKEVKEESNESGRITYEVIFNDPNVILQTNDSKSNDNNTTSSVISVSVKVTIKKNGILESLSIKDLKTSNQDPYLNDEQTEEISSYTITVNAINNDVEPVELPDDVDSYKDFSESYKSLLEGLQTNEDSNAEEATE